MYHVQSTWKSSRICNKESAMKYAIIILSLIGLCSILGVSLSSLLRSSADAVDKGQAIVQTVTKNASTAYNQTVETVEKAKKLKQSVEK